MIDLFIDPSTKKLIDAYLKSPSHALLLTGKSGVGLGTLASSIAKSLVNHKTDIVLVEPNEKGTITIERVRELYVDTRSARSSRQVVIIDNIDTMSHDAQNSFLKLLEEPNDNVIFVVTTHDESALLDTIKSRVQRINIKPISSTDSQSLLRSEHITDPKQIQQMLFVASGLPAELARLARDKAHFETKADLVRLARDFLSGKSYERLAIIGKITSRQDALEFVQSLAGLIKVMSGKSPELLDEHLVDLLEKTSARLEQNGHVKTQLSNLALNL